MKRLLAMIVVAIAATLPISAAVVDTSHSAMKAAPEATPLLDFKVSSLSGEPVDMSRYRGKVLLIVNVASKCGYTPQYAGLQALHEKYAEQGLAVLGFPANDFGAQEPGSNEEIAGFCKKNFGVSFDMFSKIAVMGENQDPLYGFLTSEKTNPSFSGEVKWNFEKFLVSRDGKVVGRYRSAIKPDDPEFIKAIEAALAP